MSSSSGNFAPLHPWPGALPLDLTGASSQTVLQARSTHAQIILNYIIPSQSLRSSFIATLSRKTSITTLRSFLSTASDVWDKLPVDPCFLCFDAASFQKASTICSFMPIPWIHYTDHQNRNLLQYHVIHLTRSSSAPTISRFLHSRLDLARYWHVCKCCVTYTLTNILRKEESLFSFSKTVSPYQGKGKFVFVFRNCIPSGVAWASPKVGPHYRSISRVSAKKFFLPFLWIFGTQCAYRINLWRYMLNCWWQCPSITAFWIKYHSYSYINYDTNLKWLSRHRIVTNQYS